MYIEYFESLAIKFKCKVKCNQCMSKDIWLQVHMYIVRSVLLTNQKSCLPLILPMRCQDDGTLNSSTGKDLCLY